jgi:hypothetical protein
LTLDDPGWTTDVLRWLEAVAGLTSPTLERTLSIRAFGKSKRGGELRAALLTILRRHDPDASLYGDSDWALLRAHQLERTPEYVPLAGPIVLRTGEGGRDLDVGAFTPSVALSEVTLRAGTVVSCSARAAITVENLTSFDELLAERPKSVLAIYTGGFASPSLIRFIAQIRASRPDLPIAHWGDLDAGGFAVLAHLRRHIGQVLPVAMDRSTLDTFRAYAQVLSPQDRVMLTHLRQHPDLLDCAPALDYLQDLGLKLEQEAVAPRVMLDHLCM